MKILIDVGHPSFVHLFKNAYLALHNSQHEVLFSCRNKDNALELLKAIKIPNIEVGKHYKSKLGKLLGLFLNTYKLYKIARTFNPDLVLSGASPYACLVCGMLGKKHFVFDDTENKEQIWFYKFGVNLVVTPEAFPVDFGRKHIKYPGVHELAYLPLKEDESVKKDSEDPLVFIRFVSWKATHDTFMKGVGEQQKIELLHALDKAYKVVISSEEKLPEELRHLEYSGNIEAVHDTLSRASLYVGESATMASEAVCLGVPAIFLYPKKLSYTKHIEQKYNLLKHYTTTPIKIDEVLAEIKALKSKNDIDKAYSQFLKETIKVTDFIVWLVGNAQSKTIKDDVSKAGFFEKFKH